MFIRFDQKVDKSLQHNQLIAFRSWHIGDSPRKRRHSLRRVRGYIQWPQTAADHIKMPKNADINAKSCQKITSVHDTALVTVKKKRKFEKKNAY